MADELKERPKVGDRVKFRSHGHARTGKVLAVAVTDVHFLIEIETPGFKYKYRKTRLNDIIRILPSLRS